MNNVQYTELYKSHICKEVRAQSVPPYVQEPVPASLVHYCPCHKVWRTHGGTASKAVNSAACDVWSSTNSRIAICWASCSSDRAQISASLVLRDVHSASLPWWVQHETRCKITAPSCLVTLYSKVYSLSIVCSSLFQIKIQRIQREVHELEFYIPIYIMFQLWLLSFKSEIIFKKTKERTLNVKFDNKVGFSYCCPQNLK